MLAKVCNRIANVMLIISILCLVLAIGINAFEIIGRFAANKSLYWIQDVTLLFMMWFIFPGMVKVFYDKQDIVIDLFIGMMPKKLQYFFNIVSNLLVTAFCAILTTQSYNFMMINYKKNMFTSQLPTKYYAFAIVFCVGITTVFSLIRTVELVRGGYKKGETK